MQAYLPDINSKYLMYTRKCLDALSGKKWGTVVGSLRAINALLPKENQVAFSTIQYNEKIASTIVSICPKCSEEVDFKSIKIMEIIAPIIDEFLTGSQSVKIWNCPKCHNDNKLSHTKIVTRKKQEPFFHKVINNPPERKDGLADRRTYDRKMEAWTWACLEELEHQMAEFRKANWKAGDNDDFNDDDIDTSLEEGQGSENIPNIEEGKESADN